MRALGCRDFASFVRHLESQLAEEMGRPVNSPVIDIRRCFGMDAVVQDDRTDCIVVDVVRGGRVLRRARRPGDREGEGRRTAPARHRRGRVGVALQFAPRTTFGGISNEAAEA
jgi:hypothetical protein